MGAQQQCMIAQKINAGAPYPGFTYDLNQDFESALGGVWSKPPDPGSIINAQDAAAKYRGTYGMSCAAGTAAEMYVLWDPTGTYSTVSAGWWYKTGQFSAFSGERYICRGLDGSDNQLFVIREGRSAGDNSRRLSWTLDSNVITVSDNTWYWVTFQWTSGGTCQLAVYTTAGAQVGSTLSATGAAGSVGKWWWGTYGISSSTATYFDDIHIDTTDATFPLGPATGT